MIEFNVLKLMGLIGKNVFFGLVVLRKLFNVFDESMVLSIILVECVKRGEEFGGVVIDILNCFGDRFSCLW